MALRPVPVRTPGQKAEPNDTIPQAQPIQPGETLIGRCPGLDDDRFAPDVTGPPQLRCIVADGGQNMRLEDTQGNGITARNQKDGSGNRLVIDDILLTGARHTIRLEGVDSSHAVTVTPKGPPPAGQERAVDRMRRPARHGLRVDTSTLPSPEPAKLSVAQAAAEDGAAGADDDTTSEPPPALNADRPAVELIIDASGAMLAQLGGEGRRIDMAHRVPDDLIRRKIPADTPVAPRAFGDDAPGSCETILRAPLSPDYLAPHRHRDRAGESGKDPDSAMPPPRSSPA